MSRTTAPLLVIAIFFLAGCSSIRDYTKDVPDTCEVHRSQMTKKVVQIRYGLFRLNSWGLALQAASTNAFPHAEEEVLGGCIVESPTQATIYVCSQCQLARQRWESEHPKPRQYSEECFAG